MDHLSSMDAAFLHFETPETPMHVGSLVLLDLPKDYAGDFYAEAKAYLASRLHLISAFRRKLALMPFDLANPVWVEDTELDLEHHIRLVILPRPGSFQKLEQLIGRLHSPLMDRSRPLWELYIIEGLASGQVAIYSKMHHAGIDGQAGVALAKVMYSLTAVAPPVKPPRVKSRAGRETLGVAELAMAAIGNAGRKYSSILKSLPKTAKSLLDMLAPVSDDDGKRRLGRLRGLKLAPKTLFNVSISNQRAFAARSVSLDEVKRMAKRSGGSVNDVVMAVCAAALRRYLSDHRDLPKEPLVAAIPVSLREPGNTDANNQVSTMLVSLATDVADPVERLRAIHESAAAAKKQMGNVRELPTDFPTFGAPWLLAGLAALAGRSKLAERLPPMINVLISNVPGPQVPLYFAGARIVANYPVSIPAHGGALNMTVQSYNGALEYGLTACRRAVPDVDVLADYVVDAHRQLLARLEEASAVEPAALATAAAPDKARPRPALPATKAVPKVAAKAAAKAGVAKARPSPRRQAAAKASP
jgi:WS/DGAT/MGAT family acyltransferase